MGTPSGSRSRAKWRGGAPRWIAAPGTSGAEHWRPPSVGVHDAAARRAELHQRQHKDDREQDHTDCGGIAEVERLEALLIQVDRDDLGARYGQRGHHLIEEVEGLK